VGDLQQAVDALMHSCFFVDTLQVAVKERQQPLFLLLKQGLQS
jgi:hypothetical protein